jgi:hypothetical protein
VSWVVWPPGSWDARNAEFDGLVAGAPVDLGELVFGSGEADLEAFDLAEPAFALGFAMRAIRLSRISAMRGLCAGSGQCRLASQAPLTELTGESRPRLRRGLLSVTR